MKISGRAVLSSPRTARRAARVATVGFGLAVLVQVLLAAGVMPVQLAWGGRRTTASVPVRLASAGAAVVLALSAHVLRRRAGLSGAGPPPRRIRVLAWVVTVLLALNTLGNLASRSKGERLLFGPLTAVLAASSLLVAASRPESPP
jgi:hypothetical protein